MEKLIYKDKAVYIGDDFKSLDCYLLSFRYSKVVLLIDQNVHQHFGGKFKDYEYVVIPCGEESKSLAYAEKLIEALIDKGLDRSGFLVGVGGGIVCDLTGFVASVFMRGIQFAFVPTTLLAQVDASIGGKNGVNLGKFKNMIGTFNQPEFILIDLNFLSSLPQNELISGMAEVVKHACIRDAAYLHFLERHVEQILAKNLVLLFDLVLHSVKIKTQIVEADERESGLRKVLNFGHTFGHAFEKILNIPHGEAVSLGIILVNKIAVSKQLLKREKEENIAQILSKFGLPTELSSIDTSELETLVFKDKKRRGIQLDLVLLRDIGQAEVVSFSVPEIQNMIQSNGYFN